MASRLLRSLGRRPDQVGMLLAGANVPLTFQRTLMPRKTMDQAIVTGLSIATNQSLVTLVQESIEATAALLVRRTDGAGHHDDDERVTRAGFALDAVAIAGGLALQRAFPQRDREPLMRAGLRTGGFLLSVTGTGGVFVGTMQELSSQLGNRRRASVLAVLPAVAAMAGGVEYMRRKRARLDTDLPSEDFTSSPLRAGLFGVGVAASTFAMAAGERAVAESVAGVLARALPGGKALYRPVGHAVALAGFGSLGRVLVQKMYSRVESSEEAVETAFDIAPPSKHVSGSFESHVDFTTLSLQGRRFVWMTTPDQALEEVMGEPKRNSPIRAYVGLESAATEGERVELALKELERTGAYDRKYLMVVSPTGTGYVNYAAVSTLEFLSRGDCATVAMQYAARPSVLSLDRVKQGRAHMALLLDGIRQRMETMPAEQRPKVVLFGESLGAWTSQDPFVDKGASGLAETGIDHAIWIGTPHFSKWKNQVLDPNAPEEDRTLVTVCSCIDDWHALDDETRAGVRYVMITHHDDGVALFGPEIAIQAPPWLGPSDTRPSHVPKGMRWMPTTTFFQVLVDMKNSANVVPGVFAAKGHDYRADLLPFFRATLGFDVSDAQIDAIGEWLQRRELQRSEWIKKHGTAGESLSAVLIQHMMEDEREAGRDADEWLLRQVRTAVTDEFSTVRGI
jgi:uncharacterized membrane protein